MALGTTNHPLPAALREGPSTWARAWADWAAGKLRPSCQSWVCAVETLGSAVSGNDCAWLCVTPLKMAAANAILHHAGIPVLNCTAYLRKLGFHALQQAVCKFQADVQNSFDTQSTENGKHDFGGGSPITHREWFYTAKKEFLAMPEQILPGNSEVSISRLRPAFGRDKTEKTRAGLRMGFKAEFRSPVG